MKVRIFFAACGACAGLVYLGSPYLALYQLGVAVQRGDVGTLAAAVDWDQVREGLKEDICDTVMDDPAPRVQTASAQVTALPPFGASFFAGIAAKVVDDTVTPDGLVATMRQAPGEAKRPAGAFGWSFFDGPTSFTARLYATDAAPILLHMQLHAGHWRVIRADLPSSMLTGMQSHT